MLGCSGLVVDGTGVGPAIQGLGVSLYGGYAVMRWIVSPRRSWRNFLWRDVTMMLRRKLEKKNWDGSSVLRSHSSGY